MVSMLKALLEASVFLLLICLSKSLLRLQAKVGSLISVDDENVKQHSSSLPPKPMPFDDLPPLWAS